MLIIQLNEVPFSAIEKRKKIRSRLREVRNKASGKMCLYFLSILYPYTILNLIFINRFHVIWSLGKWGGGATPPLAGGISKNPHFCPFVHGRLSQNRSLGFLVSRRSRWRPKDSRPYVRTCVRTSRGFWKTVHYFFLKLCS